MKTRIGWILVSLLAVSVSASHAEDKPAKGSPSKGNPSKGNPSKGSDAKDTPWARARLTRKKAAENVKVIDPNQRFKRVRVQDYVERALAWLARVQAPDGGWDARAHTQWEAGKRVNKPKSPYGRHVYDIGLTGLSATAFLVAGHTGAGKHKYDRTVHAALQHLLAAQDKDGCFGGRGSSMIEQTLEHARPGGPDDAGGTPAVLMGNRSVYLYNHAAATIAMIEAFGMTDNPIYRASAQNALNFIQSKQVADYGWKYGRQDKQGNASLTTWMALALWSATAVNESIPIVESPRRFVIDDLCVKGVVALFNKLTDFDYGTVGYATRGCGSAREASLASKFPWGESHGSTAMGAMCRILGGEDSHRSSIVMKAIRFIVRTPPQWTKAGGVDYIYWHFATMVLHQHGGKPWKRWTIDKELVHGQAQDGSWPTVDAWSAAGGRVYATAINALTLQTRARFVSRGK